MQLYGHRGTHRHARLGLAITATVMALALGLIAAPAQAEGTSLRDAAEPTHRFIGTAINDGRLSDATYHRIASTEFDSVTAENVMKWETIQPTRGGFVFAPGDRLVAFADQNDQLVYGHTLVWHSQLPSWVTDSAFSDQELRTVMTDHVTAVVDHYRGEVARWDVVNEALNEDGTLRATPFQRQLGASYLADAFRAAHAADPQAKLFLNDYNVEGLGAKSDGMYALVKRLLAQGVPISGVGLQAHLTLGDVPGSLQQNMQRFADLGLEVAVTELDVRMELPATEQKLRQQAQDYRSVTAACLAVSRCAGVTVWGFGDADSWIPGWFQGQGAANLYDEDYQPKPAYYATRDTFARAASQR